MRKIEQRKWQVTPVPIDTPFDEHTQLKNWLTEQAKTYALPTLLAHADDGVIWGMLAEGVLKLSDGAFPQVSPELRAITLQECRLFSNQAELYLWRDEDDKWQARLIQDNQGEAGDTLDEQQILWGTQAEDERDGFTLLSDGAQENQHAPPLSQAKMQFVPADNYRPVRLWVRHYLANDTDDQDANTIAPEFQAGLSYIALSRLVALQTRPLKLKEEG